MVRTLSMLLTPDAPPIVKLSRLPVKLILNGAAIEAVDSVEATRMMIRLFIFTVAFLV
jgi:hypothetical protein